MSSARIEELFAAARALPDGAPRADYLDRACASDENLRAQVEALLIAARKAGGDFPHTLPSSGRVGIPESEQAGQIIGRYKLLEQIGEGGFGVVWMAEQKEPVRRRVALKVIKLGMDTKQVVARFEQERQALALMEHPNIAQVFDAGSTETGRPYFVMELVRGVPIVQFCDEHGLDMAARLRLFIDVCRAIQHAHQKGIIHRDIKPSNVLVTLHDGVPVPKVIDFGIAKATSAELTSVTLFTELRQIVGTPTYMSPEQSEFSGLDIDTRSDVYSLGVLLYELLTGTTPFDMRKLLERGISEILRTIREVEPPRPSTRVSALGKAAAGVAQRRHADPKRLGTLLRGDLDWIVMRCLEKDRRQRYDTVNGLARDIQRHLAGEAVSAAPPSVLYRLRKVVKRHRAAVAASGAIVLALLAGVAAFAWKAYEASSQRDEALAARRDEVAQRARAEASAERADASARRAEAVNRFLVDMLDSVNVRELGREATIAQALDRAAVDVEVALRQEPESEADLRRVLARSYLSLGLLEKAEPHLVRAIELDRAAHGDSSAEYANSLGLRAALIAQRGDFASAIALVDEAIPIAERANGMDEQPSISLRCERALYLMSLRRDEEGIEVLRTEVERSSRRGRLGTSEGLRQLNSLAVMLHRQGELEEAEELYRQGLEIAVENQGELHPDALIARSNLGSMLRDRGSVDEAEALIRAASAGMERVFGAEHPKTGEALSTLGDLLKGRGLFLEALPVLERALGILVAARGERGEFVAPTKSRLAYVLSRLGEKERAIAMQRESNAAYEAMEGPESSNSLTGRLALADMLVSADRTEEAEPLYLEVLDDALRSLGAEHPLVTKTNIGLGVMLMRNERWSAAEPYVREATEAGQRRDGLDHPNSIINQYNLSCVLLELGHEEEAEELARDTVERARRVLGAQHANLAYFLGNWGKTLAALGRPEEGAAKLGEAVVIAEVAIGKPHPTTAGYLLDRARILLDAGDSAAAEPLTREALADYEASKGSSAVRLARARIELARCHGAAGRFAEAEALLVEGRSAIASARAEGHSDRERAERYLVELYELWHRAEPELGKAELAARWRVVLQSTRAAAEARSKR
ncbi:MAG: tetratricopeptide repeat protein [Planctomycetes bacterium]|nr:tetratricopeptide repeat protein [Planctomycetota bacterium]